MFAFAFALAPAVKTTDRVSMLSFLVVFVCAFVYVAVLLGTGNQDGRGNGRVKLLLALFCPFWAGHVASELISNLEGANLGVTADTWTMTGPQDEPSFAALLAITAVSIVLWAILAPVTEAASSDDSTALKTLLCRRGQCSRKRRRSGGESCWKSGSGVDNSTPSMSLNSPGTRMGDLCSLENGYAPLQGHRSENFAPCVFNAGHHEPIPTEMLDAVCVKVEGLTKIFSSSWSSWLFGDRCSFGRYCCCRRSKAKKNSHESSTKEFKAVDGLSVELCMGQIFSLLGHNGAGKTTTISIMTNALKSTSGEVIYRFGGESLRLSDEDALPLIARRTGMCPQHNILWNECTPREHLRLFARLKGVPPSEVEEAISRLLEQIALPPGDEDRPVGTLSGGNQRKTSLGIALVGDPTVVLPLKPTHPHSSL